jgi:hypothetical protein
MTLPPLPEPVHVRRNAHGFTNSFSYLQMDKYGRDCVESMQAEVDRLKGEHTVLITLLNSAYGVIETIEPESIEESDSLNSLQRQIRKAINGAIQGLV